MGRSRPPELDPDSSRGQGSSCPACGVELDGRALPPNSVVICASCCTPLLWDVSFSVLTAEQLRALPEAGRRRLCALLAMGRARLGARAPN